MIIRKATKKDIRRIVELLNSSENLAGNEGDSEGWYKSDILDFLSHKLYIVFVCELDKKIVGVSVMELHKIARHVYYYAMVVDENYRGKGIGSKMMDYAENFAKKKKVLFTWGFVEENNTAMKKLFAKRGYKEGKKFIYFSKELK